VGFKTFSHIPTENISTQFVKRVDLAGGGLTDLMFVDSQTGDVVWMENLGESGFGPAQRVANTAELPPLHSNDPSLLILLADITGDGLADVVHILSGKTVHWQNMSRDHFSKPIIMYGRHDSIWKPSRQSESDWPISVVQEQATYSTFLLLEGFMYIPIMQVMAGETCRNFLAFQRSIP
jgi:hypothetical protein